MSKPIRALIVEDVEDDALLLVAELTRGGYAVTFERVDTAAAMLTQRHSQIFDVVSIGTRVKSTDRGQFSLYPVSKGQPYALSARPC